MRGGLFPILCVKWTLKNSIAPESTYTSHYYYYSTKTTLTVAKKTSVGGEFSCILKIHLSTFLSQKEFPLLRAGHEKCQTRCHPYLTPLLTYCSVTFRFCNHKQNVPYQKQNQRFCTARLTVNQQQISHSHVSLHPLYPV